MDLVYLVCAAHLFVCVVQIAITPGSTEWRIGSVLVSQTAQWVNTTFCCLSIISIIAAGVGALYTIERHLNIYFYVLLASGLGDVFILAWFAWHGTACETLVEDAQIEKSSMSCKFTETGTIVIIAVLLLFKLVSMAIVSKARKAIRVKYGEDLLPHMKKSLQQSFSQGDTFLTESDAMAAQPFAAANAAPVGPQLSDMDYGSASLRSRGVSRLPAPVSAPTVAAAPAAAEAYPSVAGQSAMRSAPAAVLAAQQSSQYVQNPSAVTGPIVRPILAA